MRHIAFALAGLMLAGAASSATAQSLTPTSVNFTGNGSFIIYTQGTSIPCNAQVSGSIDASGVAHFTNVALSGGLLNICTAMSAQNLPYTMTGWSTTNGDIQTIQIGGGPLGFPCISASSNVTFLEPGHFSFTFSNGNSSCTGKGEWRVSVPLKVSP